MGVEPHCPVSPPVQPGLLHRPRKLGGRLDVRQDTSPQRNEEVHRIQAAQWFIALIAVPGAVSGAVAKFTLKRLHQMVTARYFARSASAGIG